MILAHWLKSVARRNRTTQFAAGPAATLRRTRRKHGLVVAAHVESLEDRTLLAAVIPGLTRHGVSWTTPQAAGKTAIVVDGAADATLNTKLSNNAGGSGLYFQLDNAGGTLNALKTITIANVDVKNNGNAGIQINLSNINLDKLEIDRATVTDNGGAGLYVNLNNATIGQLIIRDSKNGAVRIDPATGAVITNPANSGKSSFSNNKTSDGINFVAVNSTIGTLRLSGNVISGNVGNGAFFKLEKVNVTTLDLNDNEVKDNTAGSGIRFQNNRMNLGIAPVAGQVKYNTFSGNSSHGLSFFSQSLDGLGNPTAGTSGFAFPTFSDNTFASNGGSGVSVYQKAQVTWKTTVLRNTFTGNTFRGYDLKSEDTGTVSVDPTNGDFIPTKYAFDVTFGGLQTTASEALYNANTFDLNGNAGIALQLTDTKENTANTGFTNGTFKILGNTITGTTADANAATNDGNGILIVAAGSVALQNGSSIYYGSTIDRNTLTGNAGDGVRFEISEDSEVNGLTIGNLSGDNQTFDVNGDFGGGGNVETVQGDGNVIDSNGGNGISFIRRSSAIVQRVRILDNRITRNAEGVYLEANDTYKTVPEAARPNLPVVNGFVMNQNDLSNNRLNGAHFRTVANAVLSVDMTYNRIDANGLNGLRLTGVENNFADFENTGGVWTKNAITNNGQNGIEVETVTGSVNPLVIGRDGRDNSDGQSLGNFIYHNGEDGIDVTSSIGRPGSSTPRDTRDGMDIINNNIVENGRNAVGSPYIAGKGIDIEVLQSSPREFRIDRNAIQGNAGDGIELRNAGGMLRVTAMGNFIDLNGGRGVDLLNQIGAINYNAEAFIHFGDFGTTDVGNGVLVGNRNAITNNGLEGFYVVNTAAPTQRQDVNNESTPFDTTSDVVPLSFVAVNLVLDIQNNVIRDNGNGVAGLNDSPPSDLSGTGLVINVGTQVSGGSFSTAPDLAGNSSFFVNDDFTGSFTDTAAAGVGSNIIQGPGTVGILQQDSGGISTSANGRINARVIGNEFSGNLGDDVFTQSFTSLLPRTTTGEWTDQFFRNIANYDRDPLSRMNMVFTGNTLDSMDVNRGVFSQDNTNAGAHYENGEGDFKSRTNKTAPNPSGPFSTATRTRNGQRVAILGHTSPDNTPNGHADFYYDGLGASTFRVEDSWRGTNTFRANQLGDTFDQFYEETPRGTNNLPFYAVDYTYAWDEVSAGTFSFMTASISDVKVNEASGTATLTVTLSEDAPVGGVTLFYNTTDGTAKADPNNDGDPSDGDYDAVIGGSVTIGAGQRTATIPININTDAVIDPDEAFYVDLYQTSFGDFVDSRGIVRISEPPHISVSDVTVNEGAGVATVTVSLSSPPDADVTFDYSTANGSAIAPGDYTAAPATPVTIPGGSGDVTYTFDIPIIDDGNIEPNETFLVNLTNVLGAVVDDSQAVVTIVDNDIPDVTIDDVVVNEADGTATFTVSLSKAVNVPVTVQYTVNSGVGASGAVAGSDFTAAPGFPLTGQITIPAGTTTGQIKVNIVDDNVSEGDETFSVTLTGATNGSIADDTGGALIKDNDAPIVTIGPPVTVTEGDPGQSVVARFKLTLDKAPAQQVSITVKTVDYSAKAGQDYTAVNKVVTFAPGQTEAFVDVPLVNDLATEGFEQFFIAMSNPNGVSIGGSGYTVAGVYDNDTPTISAKEIGVVETDGTATFTVTLSKAVANAVGVSYAITGGTATAGTDFTAGTSPLSGGITFAPGETVKTVTINIVNDGVDEQTETFYLNLGGAANGAIDPAIVANGYKVLGRIIDPNNALVSFAVGSGPGSSAAVKVYDAFGRERSPNAFSDIPGVYTSAFMTGINVAVGDVNGDGIADIIVAPQKSNTPAPIRVFEGKSLGLMASFFPFSDRYTGGVSIAVGDIDPQNGNGVEIFAATSTGDSAIGVYRVSQFAPTAGKLTGYYAFPGTTGAMINGIDIAVADILGNDGRVEVVAAPNGGSAGPVIRVLDWTGGFLNSFYAFDPSYAGGVNVAAGDVNGDGQAEVIASLQAGNPPLVRVFNALSGGLMNSFFAYSPSYTGGVSVGVGDVNFDGRADILTAPASNSVVAVYARDGLTGAVIPLSASPSGSVTPQTWGSFTGGATVAGQAFPLPFGQSLLYAETAVDNPNAVAVTQTQARNLAKAAMARLAAAGASAADVAKLAKVKIVVSDLAGSQLGLASAGTVTIDVNAAGVGWYIDSTPGRDEEFVRGADGVYRAVAPRAAGKVDLLTVLTHELAHLIGFEDLNATTSPNSLMTGTLSQGVRRATRQQLDDLFADDSVLGALLTA